MNGTTNTFVDESASAHAITAVGDATQLATKDTRTAGFFDGDSDYLSIADSADWDFGTGDFSVEMDIFGFAFAGANRTLIGTNSEKIDLIYRDGNGIRAKLATTNYDFAWTPAINTWYTVKLTRTGTNLVCKIDNVAIGTTLTASDDVTGVTSMYIGANATPAEYFNGWIKNVKITKAGTTVLDLPMNPPTGLGSPISSTAWFDGNSDYVTIPDSTDWDFSDSNFSWECYVRFNALASCGIIGNGTDGNNYTALAWDNVNGRWSFVIAVGGGIAFDIYGSDTIATNTWYKIKIERTGANAWAIKRDDITLSTSVAAYTYPSYTGGFGVGGNFYGSGINNYLSGYIRNVKIIKAGTTVLDLKFEGTPDDTDNTNGWLNDSSASAHTVSANGTAVCKYIEDYRNRQIEDKSASAHEVVCVGTAKLDWVSVEGTGVLKLDGSGDYLSVPDSADFFLSTNDFAGKFWIKPIALPADNSAFIGQIGTQYWEIKADTTANIRLTNEGQFSTAFAHGFRINEWFYVEVTKASDVAYFFVNGSLIGSEAFAYTFANATGNLRIGAGRADVVNNAYYDVVILANGTAGHTAAYIPPKYGLGGSRGWIL